MSLETGTYLDDLNTANPPGADPKSQGDDHIRLLKYVIRNSFAGFIGAVLVGGESTGTAGVYTLNPATPLPSYDKGTLVAWKPNIANPGASSLNISGLGARSILQSDGTALKAGDLSTYVLMIDTGTEYRLVGITKNYADQLALSAALPTPPVGSDTYFLVYTNGGFTYQTSPVPDFLLQAQGIS